MKRWHLWGAGVICLLPSCATDSGQPNIVFVFPDQMRASAMGFWSQEGFSDKINYTPDPVCTPNLDTFARESLVLSSVYSNCPVSSPYRGSFLTGMYPNASGIPINCRSDRPYSTLRTDAECISDVLSAAGYDCAYIGKLHAEHPTPNDPQRPGEYSDPRLPAWDAYTPPQRRHGFNFWYSYGTFDEHKNPHYWDNDGNRHDPHEWSPVHEAGIASAYIRNEGGVRDKRKPFFMVVGMNPPHSPYKSSEDCMEEDIALYENIPVDSLLVRPNADAGMEKAACVPYYFASVTGVDRAFGDILKAIRDAGLEKNTIVVFTSDHGETMCSHGIDEPKNVVYTEATNVPFIIRYPGRLKPRVDKLLLSSPDIMPTLLGIAGLADKIPAAVQGRDLSTALFDVDAAVQRPEYALYIKNLDGPFTTGDITDEYFPVSRGLKTDRYTICLTIDKEGAFAGHMLFDDVEDPYQMNSIPLEDCPELVSSLCDRMAAVLKEINDPWYTHGILPEMIHY